MEKSDLEKLKKELEETIQKRKVIYLDEYRLKKNLKRRSSTRPRL